MDFLTSLPLLILFFLASYYLLKKFAKKDFDDLELIILSIVSIFLVIPAFLILFNLTFGIKFSLYLLFGILAIVILPAGYFLFKNKDWKETFKFNLDFKQVGVLIGVIILYLFLTSSYFAQNTMWADEALDEVTAENLMEIGQYKVTRNDLYALMHRSPFNPFSLAMFYSFFGESINILYSFNIVYGILSILLIYLITRRLFSPVAGYISAFLTVFSTLFLFYSLRYLTEIPQIFITALGVYFAVIVFLEKKYNYLPVLTGLIGISFLTKPVLIVLAPAFILGFFVIEKQNSLKIIKDNWKIILISIFSILIILSPHFVYSYKETGNFLETTEYYYGASLGEQQKMPFLWFVTNSAWIYSSLSIVILAILGILLGIKSNKGRFLTVSLLVIYLAMSLALTYKEDRYIMFAFPLVFPLASFGFYYFINKIREMKESNKIIIYIVLLVLGILTVTGTVFEYGGDTKRLIENKIPSYYDLQEGGRYLGQVMGEDEIAISNSGPELGYYGDRKTLYIRMGVEEFKEQVAKYNVNYVAMTAFEGPQTYATAIQKYQSGQINIENPENAFEYLLTSGEFEIVHGVQSSQGGTTIIIFKKKENYTPLA